MGNPRTEPLTEPTESERTLAVALIALAGTVLVGIITLAVLILPNIVADGTALVYWIAAAILFLLIVSMFFGGRGFSYGPGHKGFWDRFNLQATTGLVAVILIFPFGYAIKIAEAPSDYDSLADRVDALSLQIVTLESKISEASQLSKTTAEQVNDQASEIDRIDEKIDVLTEPTAE